MLNFFSLIFRLILFSMILVLIQHPAAIIWLKIYLHDIFWTFLLLPYHHIYFFIAKCSLAVGVFSFSGCRYCLWQFDLKLSIAVREGENIVIKIYLKWTKLFFENDNWKINMLYSKKGKRFKAWQQNSSILTDCLFSHNFIADLYFSNSKRKIKNELNAVKYHKSPVITITPFSINLLIVLALIGSSASNTSREKVIKF